MKTNFPRLTVATLVVGCIASCVGCYPAYNYGNGSAYNQDAKGYVVPREPMPPQPGYAGVDPGLAIAGVAAAGLLGYALGNNHGSHHHGYYGGGGYYRPAYYGRGYYGPRYCR